MADDDNDLSIRKRLVDASANDQEPKDRLWAAIIVLAVIALASGITTAVYAENTRDYLETSRVLGYQRGSVDCLSVIVDNDRTFELPNYCRKRSVAVYFPPEVCDSFFEGHSYCGSRWESP